MDWFRAHKIILSLVSILGIGGSVALGVVLNEPPFIPETLGWIRPTTDAEWAEDVKNEQLNMRLDFQLEEMRDNLSRKIIIHKDNLDTLLECPDCFKYP